MKVILLENLKKIGSIGEIIDVKRGFARNFLIANNKALYASKENVTKVEKIKSELSKKDNEKKTRSEEISKLIKEIDDQGIKPSMIQPIKDIKSIGKFKVKISLHSEVDAEIIINVVSSETIQ